MSTHNLSVTICAALAQGGIAHYSYCLAAALQVSGISITQLMYAHPKYDLDAYPHAHRVVRSLRLGVSLPSRLTSPFLNLQSMLRACSRSRLVHLQWSLGARTDRLHLPMLRRLGKAIVYTAHDVLPHEASIMSEEHARWLYNYPEALFVHGDALRNLMVGRFGVPAARVHVIPHGNFNFIADAPGPWDRRSARASLGFQDDDRVVLFFGLIREYKGLDTLIEACRLLKKRAGAGGGRLKLIIAGRAFQDHWNKAGYEAAIGKAGMADVVQLHLRHIDMQEIARFFRAADVLAVPYKRGSQSGVLRLAQSFGLAAVATRVGSLSEVSGQDVTRFVAPDNPGAFADALGELLTDPERAAQLGANARFYADNELSWDRIAHTTRGVYDAVLAARAR